MLTPRRKVILRQIVRPPYVYRWMGLLTVVGLFLVITTAVVLNPVPPTVLAAGAIRAAIPETVPEAVPQAAPAGAPAEPPAAVPAAAPSPGAAPLPGVAPLPAAVPGAPGAGLSAATAAATRPAFVPGRLAHVDAPGRKVVALTFDDGPQPASTPQILDLLAEYEAPAAFCMVGEQARAHPDLVRRVVAEGHKLCNHTISHDAGIGDRTPDVMTRQLLASRDAITGPAGPGVSVDYFRAPEGRWSLPLEEAAAAQFMRPLGWSVDTLDWSKPGPTAIVDTVRRGVFPGSVVLFHDGGGPRDQTVTALRELLPWLRDQGYTFVLPT